MAFGLGSAVPMLKPVSDWVDPRRNALMGLSAGFLQGDAGAAMRYAQQGAGIDRQTAIEAEEAARQQRMAEEAAALKTKYSAFFTEQGRPDIAQGIADGVLDPGEQYIDFITPRDAANAPANVQEWEYFSNLSPEDQSQYLTMKRSVPYLDQGTQFGRPDPVTGVIGSVVPKDNETAAAQKAAGGVLGTNQAERQIQAPIQNANLQRLDAQTDNVIETIDKASGQASWDSTGLIGQVLGGVAGTKAFDLRETAKTVKANLGFAELQAMRDASPTGGALGQVAVQELESLQSTLASLNPDQSEDQLRDNLNKVRELLERQKTYRRMASEAKFGTPAPSGANAPEGVWVYNPATGKLEQQ